MNTTITSSTAKIERPWSRMWTARIKLDALKKKARQARNTKWKREHYDEFTRIQSRNQRRKVVGIPLDAPVQNRGRKPMPL